MMTSDLVHGLHQIWNTGNLDMIDSVYASDFLAHWPASFEIPERRGIDGIRLGVTRIRTAFHDWHERELDVFGSADKVASAASGGHLKETALASRWRPRSWCATTLLRMAG